MTPYTDRELRERDAELRLADRITNWALAVALILALSFIYGFVDGTIVVHTQKEQQR